MHGGGGWGSCTIAHPCVHVLHCVCKQAVVVVVAVLVTVLVAAVVVMRHAHRHMRIYVCQVAHCPASAVLPIPH